MLPKPLCCGTELSLKRKMIIIMMKKMKVRMIMMIIIVMMKMMMMRRRRKKKKSKVGDYRKGKRDEENEVTGQEDEEVNEKAKVLYKLYN